MRNKFGSRLGCGHGLDNTAVAHRLRTELLLKHSRNVCDVLRVRRARSAYASDADELATVAEDEEDSLAGISAQMYADDERAHLVTRM